MNKLSVKRKALIVQLLCEGNSQRSTSRITGASIVTVAKVAREVGYACIKFHSHTIIKVKSARVQVDEMFSFISAKEKNVKNPQFGIGSVWNWIAMDPDTKLVISWFSGQRDERSAKYFMTDLYHRLGTRVQLTSDGYPAYIEAVADTFGGKVDFAQVVKNYSTESTNKQGKPDKRERYIGAIRKVVTGKPDPKYISTSLLERQNLTVRMSCRRFTRATNAFSKKYSNHCFALGMHFVHYNFVRLHKTLNITPAMKAGFSKRFMSFEDMVELSLLYPFPLESTHKENKKLLHEHNEDEDG